MIVRDLFYVVLVLFAGCFLDLGDLHCNVTRLHVGLLSLAFSPSSNRARILSQEYSPVMALVRERSIVVTNNLLPDNALRLPIVRSMSHVSSLVACVPTVPGVALFLSFVGSRVRHSWKPSLFSLPASSNTPLEHFKMKV